MSVKGLHKIIYPFAPDQSGAASVLYELGGIIIICDAGGCAGNVCGFDEPRWLTQKSCIFSAGLRDMDAIMGRDDLLVEKVCQASSRLKASFVAIVGTPVPATIATDYRAIRRMIEKKTGLPVITIDTNGADLYDAGASKAYYELFRRFADDDIHAADAVGVIGVTPLDTNMTDAGNRIAELLTAKESCRVICYGAGGTPDEFISAGGVSKNIVTAPSGLRAARYLRDRFGTPYECYDPLAHEVLDKIKSESDNKADLFSGRRVLIIHQQIRANTLRNIIRQNSESDITVATWFRLDGEIMNEGDFRISSEEDFTAICEAGDYDIIMADGSLERAAGKFDGIYIDLPHFAISG